MQAALLELQGKSHQNQMTQKTKLVSLIVSKIIYFTILDFYRSGCAGRWFITAHSCSGWVAGGFDCNTMCQKT